MTEQREIKFKYIWSNPLKKDFITAILTLDEIENGKQFEVCKKALENYELIARVQSTGLFDKNGKEIFSGDIVSWDFDKTLKTVIEFKWGCFGYKSFSSVQIKNSDDFIKIDEHKARSMEIVGNAFETPELLNLNNKE